MSLREVVTGGRRLREAHKRDGDKDENHQEAFGSGYHLVNESLADVSCRINRKPESHPAMLLFFRSANAIF